MFYTQVNRSPELYFMKVNEPVLLNNPEIVGVVQSGKLAVFATRVKDGSPDGYRRYLFSVSAGAALLGAALLPEAIAPNQWGFVAVAIEPTKLCQMPITDLVKRIRESDLQATAFVEDWIYHLSQALSTQPPVSMTPLNLVQQDFERNFSLSTGEALQLWQKTVVWVKLHQGNAHWMGVEELALNSTSSAFPLATAMWLEAENSVAGQMLATAELEQAELFAGLAEDIEQMPMGMHTVISEGGTNLSGGQRQRLLIARSLVSKPKIILMDEATSALDNRTQAIVTESLDRLNATRIVIAHRLSTIRHADRIYVMDAGRVVQVGTFSELIAQEGLFARLVARQLEDGV